MDNRPIGVFDSGLGGLTGVSELMKLLPNEDIIFLGDTGRVPYGGRSRETIIRYTRSNIEFLRRFNIKAILVACGTVSAAALDTIAGDYDLPIFGVVESAAESAVKITKNKKVGLIATEASIKSGAYNKRIKAIDPDILIFEKACPLLVPLVENGRVTRGDLVTETVVREYLSPLKGEGIDALILGCTHYPLLSGLISDFLGCGVSLINSSLEAAKFLAKKLEADDMLSNSNLSGTNHYYVSDSPEGFSRLASLFLGRDIHRDVEQIEL